MKEETKVTAAREADLPAIFHKTLQADNPDRRLPATVAPLLACPGTALLRLALCPQSLTKFRA
jgi:hypothetical protein